jgi:hypothetical protein
MNGMADFLSGGLCYSVITGDEFRIPTLALETDEPNVCTILDCLVDPFPDPITVAKYHRGCCCLLTTVVHLVLVYGSSGENSAEPGWKMQDQSESSTVPTNSRSLIASVGCYATFRLSPGSSVARADLKIRSRQ